MKTRARLMSKPEHERTTKKNGNGSINKSLPASEQFMTRSCARCAGLLVSEWCYDLSNSDAHRVETFRCVQCGHRIDPVILQNQIKMPVERRPRQQVWPTCSVNTTLLGEVA
jgi:hypothetical protein